MGVTTFMVTQLHNTHEDYFSTNASFPCFIFYTQTKEYTGKKEKKKEPLVCMFVVLSLSYKAIYKNGLVKIPYPRQYSATLD